jgi:predicted site-specific integrase-resolvase
MEKRFKPGEFAQLVNRKPQTLRKWDKAGKLPAKRTLAGHRYYTQADLALALNIERKPIKPINLIYCRVSSPKQKEDLIRQREYLSDFVLARGLEIDEIIEDIAGGLNYTRPKFLDIMERIEARQVKNLIIAHKDRLCRFGFDYFNHFLEAHGGSLIIANQVKMSPQQELLDDLMAVVPSFSCRLYGVRKYKTQINKLLQATE